MLHPNRRRVARRSGPANGGHVSAVTDQARCLLKFSDGHGSRRTLALTQPGWRSTNADLDRRSRHLLFRYTRLGQFDRCCQTAVARPSWCISFQNCRCPIQSSGPPAFAESELSRQRKTAGTEKLHRIICLERSIREILAVIETASPSTFAELGRPCL